MIGQAHVTEPLMTALRTGRIGHAYLFSGPRGCGKTTSARILARCLNCTEGPTDTPCGTCPSCVELSRDGGGSLDVVEIDAASHGGVDDARELRERAVFAPARDRFKIFIIDEAHMVTSGGFNALLKIVEEPPPHVKFIFATTEPEKVIGTIRSRTHHYPFRLIAPGALIDYVQQLCDSEGVQVEPGVLALVVRSGGGSVRDTLSILDQLIAGSEGTSVTLERATGLLGFTSAELIDEVVQALGSGDSAAAFGATDRVVQTGQDPRRFVEDLLERLRDLIVISATSVQGASAVFRGVPDDQLERMFAQSQAFGHGQLSRVADVVSGTLDTMVGATAPRLHLELMVARALLAVGGGGVGAGGAGASAGAGAGAGAGLAMPGSVAAAAPAGAPSASASAPAARPSVSASVPAQTAPAAAPAAPAPSAAAPGGAPAAAAPAAKAPAAAQNDAVDVIAAMKSARDFLRSDDSGTARPPMVPLGGHPNPTEAAEAPAAPVKPKGASESSVTAVNAASAPMPPASAEPAEESATRVSAQASASENRTEQAQPTPQSPQPAAQRQVPAAALSADAISLDELLETWPELLEELLESDRNAWNAVRQVQPLAIEGEMLTVGLASKADLDAFKMNGAGPLREALAGAFGINVKYVPKPLPEGVRPMFANREGTDDAPQEPSLTAEPNTQGPSGRVAPPAEVRAAADAAEPPAPVEPAADDYPEPEYEPNPEPDLAPEAESAPEPEPVPLPEPKATPTPVPVSAPRAKPEPEQIPEPTQTPDSASGPVASVAPEKPKQREAPGFTRYGESVVREVLGARFIEERPLPEGFER